MSVLWEADDGEAGLRLRHTPELGYFFEPNGGGGEDFRIDVDSETLLDLAYTIYEELG